MAQLAGAAPLIVTFHGTDVRHHLVGHLSRRLAWRLDLVAGVSRALFEPEDGRPGLPAVPGSAVLPCGPDLRALRADAAGARRGASWASTPRRATSSSPPTRRGRRSATTAPPRSRRACGADLLTGGSIEPEQMPLWLNAANAVLVTSDYEGFGMAAVEALACEVPVLSTDVGIAPYALRRNRRLPLRTLRRRRLGGGRARPPRGRRPTRRRRRAGGDALGGGDGGEGDRGLPRGGRGSVID